jgi:membrane protease YdiL (CAAX protease family)
MNEPQLTQPLERESTPAFSAPRVLGIATIVTLCVTGLSHGLPADWAGTAVGIAFLWTSHWLVLRDEETLRVRHYGVAFGGLFEPIPVDLRRIVRETSVALVNALAVAASVFPPFFLGFVLWWKPAQGFHPAPIGVVFDDVLGQLLMVALPEETFYRGFVQTALDDVWKRRWRCFGGHLSWGIIVSSAIFALGHLLTEFNVTRLAVFFPSLLFGWMRTRTRGVGAGIFFHAFCNLYSAYLGRSFGLWH